MYKLQWQLFYKLQLFLCLTPSVIQRNQSHLLVITHKSRCLSEIGFSFSIYFLRQLELHVCITPQVSRRVKVHGQAWDAICTAGRYISCRVGRRWKAIPHVFLLIDSLAVCKFIKIQKCINRSVALRSIHTCALVMVTAFTHGFSVPVKNTGDNCGVQGGINITLDIL